ncbi:MAG: MraY family glycosyltransferase [Proteiniphilum sp.]
MELYISLLAALVSSGLLSWIALPEIQRICFQKKLFDAHDERKVHAGIVPRLGGASFLPVMILSFLLVLSGNILLKTPLMADIHMASLLEWTLLLPAIIFLSLTGLVDDLVEVRYRTKLLIQLIAAALFTASGVWINDLHGLFGLYEISPVVGVPLTIIIIISVINAFNFIDGIDGLAAGIAMLAFLFFGITLIYLRLYIISIFLFAALGMLIPFLFYNIFGKASDHSKIFMGDCGSLTLGMLLAAIAVKVYHSVSIGSDHSSLPLVLGFSILIVPMLDALRVVVLRVIKGKSPFKPDRNHMHHLLLDLGFSHRVATLIMLTNALFFGAVTIFFAPRLNVNLMVGVVVLLWGLIDFFLRRRVRQVRSASPRKIKTMNPVVLKKTVASNDPS